MSLMPEVLNPAKNCTSSGLWPYKDFMGRQCLGGDVPDVVSKRSGDQSDAFPFRRL